MLLITPALALIIFGIILVIAAIIGWWMNDYATYDKGSFHTFIAVFTGLGVFITFLFYLNLITLQQQQQQLAAIQEMARVNDSVLNSVLNSIVEASTIIPNFVLSITPLTNKVCCDTEECNIPVEPDPVNSQTCTEKFTLSYRIFALWQDVLVANHFIHFDPESYVSNFLQRANSKQLFEQWTVNKINFNKNTQSFGDLLFEYGLPIVIQTPEEYTKVAIQLINDPRYKDLFN
jgi:hypothetical protein